MFLPAAEEVVLVRRRRGERGRRRRRRRPAPRRGSGPSQAQEAHPLRQHVSRADSELDFLAPSEILETT